MIVFHKYEHTKIHWIIYMYKLYDKQIISIELFKKFWGSCENFSFWKTSEQNSWQKKKRVYIYIYVFLYGAICE